MRIKTLRVHDFKRIRDVAIDTDRAIVVLAGKNGAGKSSALDAITAALTGGRAIPEEPIRRGAESGEIEVVIDDVTVKRTFTRKEDGTFGGTLRITTADGMRPGAPQAWLDARIGDLSCDPLAFLAAHPDKQAERLRKIAGVDTSALDAKRKAAYDIRTEIGRDGAREGAALEKMPPIAEAPAGPVAAALVEPEPVAEPAIMEPALLSAAEIIAEIEAATATERAAAEARRIADAAAGKHAAADAAAGAAEARVAELRDLIAAAESVLSDARTTSDGAAAKADAADTAAARAAAAVVDSAPARAKLAGIEAANAAAREAAGKANAAARATATEARAEAARVAAAANRDAQRIADETNAKVRANAARAQQAAKVKELRAAYSAKTAEIEGIDTERTAMLAAATFPVAGLGFGNDGGITFGGFPLAQASGADRVRVAMGIALAANPTIRVVLIRDAALLDDDSMALVAALADEAGAQVWLERVRTDDTGAVIVTDGAVA